MIKMLLVAPFKKMARDFQDVFPEHNKRSTKAEYEVEQYSLDCIVAATVDHLDARKFDAEVVISRGLIASDLRTKDFFVPLVEIPVAANDIVRALHRARDLAPGEPIAVTGAPNMIMGAEELASILCVETSHYLVPSDAAIDDVVQRVIRDGHKVLIGGIHTTEKAAARGLKTVLLESSRESIWHSLTEAKRLAYLMRREEEKTERLNTVLNHSEEAVIMLDPKGKIQVFNRSAERIFDIPEGKALGRNLEKIFPAYTGFRPHREDASGVAELIRTDKLSLSVVESPLVLREKKVGSLLTVQDVSKIQELETRIREKLHSQGHLAKSVFRDIVGESRKIRETVAIAREYSATDSTIMIIGKTGTGKEVFAQSIHNASPRRTGSFVAINCAALTENLLESELFGYADGAFTGALKGGKPGLFEIAHRGTLFLDEIAEIPTSLQVKLLRALQEKEIRRVGHDKIIPVDVRVLAATNQDLHRQVEKGVFREDLFYRLNVLELQIPELRERREDIPALINHFLRLFSQSSTSPTRRISPEAMSYLKSLDWPGNVRQIKNLCERIAVLFRGSLIGLEELRTIMMTSYKVLAAPVDTKSTRLKTLHQEKNEREYEKIMEALREADFKKGRAAEVLGISRTSLWRKMKDLDIS